MMDAFRRDRARKRLHNALAIAPDEPFLQMAWGLHALRIGRPDLARQVIEVPAEAVNQATGQPLAIHAWEVETLVNQLVLTPKRPGRRGYQCRNFGTASEFTNYLRDLENAEYALKADPVQVLKEMHRIGQRQFPWQRQMPNLPDFYRPIFLYGQGGCAAAFEEEHGLSVSQFVLIGFGLYAAFSARPHLARRFDLTALGVTPAQLEAALGLLSIPAAQAPAALRATIRNAGAAGAETAYRPSLLRRHPILAYGPRDERLWAPLPDLILQRVTFGLYYDVIRPGGALRNEIAARFEAYAVDLVRE